jgi:hypothetical protein
MQTSKYAPPPGPPPGQPRVVQFPFIRSDELVTLYTQGYARLHLPASHPLLDAASALFSSSREFFAKDVEYKERFHLSKLADEPKVQQSSDEGWSCVQGEKEMLTVRRSEMGFLPWELYGFGAGAVGRVWGFVDGVWGDDEECGGESWVG